MITLQYLTKIIRLRNPDFANREQIDLARINRKTRGGDAKVFRDSIWPKTKTLDYKFSFLNQDDLNNLLSFMNYSLGQIIHLIDYEGREWDGIITTPSADVSQPGRKNWTGQFQFQIQL